MQEQDHAARLALAMAQLRPEQAPAAQWKALCRHLVTLKAEQQAPLIRPLSAALQRLPDAVRIADPEWIFRQRQGQRVPALFLARALVWSSPRMDDQALEAMLAFPDFPYLSSLKLFGQSLSSKSANCIAQAPRLARLESLNLTSNHIDGDGLRALLQGPQLPALRRLFLGRNQLRDSDAQWLMQTAVPAPLERLCLRDNQISAAMQSRLMTHFQDLGIELSLATRAPKSDLVRRKRGRPSKKKPKT